jgi:hypothetical protein
MLQWHAGKGFLCKNVSENLFKKVYDWLVEATGF